MDVSTEEQKPNLKPVTDEAPEASTEESLTGEGPQEEKDRALITAKVLALKQLVAIQELIFQGNHPGYMYSKIDKANIFVNSLHKQVMDEINAHPNQALVVEIIQENMKKGETNAKN